MGDTMDSFLPATTMVRSVDNARDAIAPERNVPSGTWFGATGGQGKSALSVPILLDSPAARITPHRLNARLIAGRLAERELTKRGRLDFVFGFFFGVEGRLRVFDPGGLAMKPAHVREFPFHIAAHRDQLRRDRDSNFFRSDGPNIQSDGSVNPVK